MKEIFLITNMKEKVFYIKIILKNMMENLKMGNIVLVIYMKLMIKIIFIYIIKIILKAIKFMVKEKNIIIMVKLKYKDYLKI